MATNFVSYTMPPKGAQNGREQVQTTRQTQNGEPRPGSSRTSRPCSNPEPVAHCSRSSPRAESPDKPLIVEDEIYTAHRPTQDRDILAKAITTLAVNIKEGLDEDHKSHNNRYALRMRLCNRVNMPDNRRWDEFEVHLPNEHICWNDVDVEEIEYHILEAIITNIDEYDRYNWFKVRVTLDEFMKSELKPMIDEMDEEWEEEREDYRHNRIRLLQRQQLCQMEQDKLLQQQRGEQQQPQTQQILDQEQQVSQTEAPQQEPNAIQQQPPQVQQLQNQTANSQKQSTPGASSDKKMRRKQRKPKAKPKKSKEDGPTTSDPKPTTPKHPNPFDLPPFLAQPNLNQLDLTGSKRARMALPDHYRPRPGPKSKMKTPSKNQLDSYMDYESAMQSNLPRLNQMPASQKNSHNDSDDDIQIVYEAPKK